MDCYPVNTSFGTPDQSSKHRTTPWVRTMLSILPRVWQGQPVDHTPYGYNGTIPPRTYLPWTDDPNVGNAIHIKRYCPSLIYVCCGIHGALRHDGILGNAAG